MVHMTISNIPRQMSQNRFFFSNLLYLLLGVDAGSTRLQGKLFRPSDHFETRHLWASVFFFRDWSTFQQGIGNYLRVTWKEGVAVSEGNSGLSCCLIVSPDFASRHNSPQRLQKRRSVPLSNEIWIWRTRQKLSDIKRNARLYLSITAKPFRTDSVL